MTENEFKKHNSILNNERVSVFHRLFPCYMQKNLSSLIHKYHQVAASMRPQYVQIKNPKL
jgi:hypothetical protein